MHSAKKLNTEGESGHFDEYHTSDRVRKDSRTLLVLYCFFLSQFLCLFAMIDGFHRANLMTARAHFFGLSMR